MNPIELQDETHPNSKDLFLIGVGSNDFVRGGLHTEGKTGSGDHIVRVHLETNNANLQYVGNQALFAAIRNLHEQLVAAAPDAAHFDILDISFSKRD